MDSLTQITLGAAVAEVVAGKKIGNRAILWGAIAGTIPDLDIIANLWMDDIDALAFHRGISHSFFFAIIGAFGFGWLVDRLYQLKYHKYIASFGWGILFLFIFFGVNANIFTGFVNIPKAAGSLVLLLGSYYFLYRRYFVKEISLPEADYWMWVKLFFWAIVTHPILDCFTMFGTQLFQPFSDQRVSFDNISVADPLYTVPFLGCVILMSFCARTSRRRRIINWVGIAISSFYMLITIYNKQRINYIFESSLRDSNVVYNKYVTGPTILNNVLWHGAAETDTSIVYGLYSFFDEEKEFELIHMPKKDYLLEARSDDKAVNTLKWFSDGFYTVMRKKDGRLQMNDLRYGTFTEEGELEDRFIFKFILTKNAQGYYDMEEDRRRPDDDPIGLANDLWTRMKGI